MPFRPKKSRFWHYDFQIGGCRFHGSCGTEDYEEAKAVEAQARVAAKAAPKAQPGLFRLSEAIGTYWTDVSQHQPSARTSWGQGKAVLSVLDPAMVLADLTQADLQRFVSVRRAEVSNGTVNRQLQYFGRAVRHMVKVYGATVPQLDFKAVETKEPIERIRELTKAEQARLFEKLRPDLHPIAKMALMTGARRATLTGLLWSDVDLNTRRIRFQLKGGGQMHFPINAELRAFLSALPKSDLPEHRRYVLTFVDEQTGERRRFSANGGGIWEDWREAVDAADIVNFRFHDLRHTFATRMLRQTGNLKLVSRLLGHTQIETTMRYAHVMDEDMHDALAGFSLLGEGESRKKSRRKA